MVYRTKTYIAGDWDNDKVAVDQLYQWKRGERWSLDFSDAHQLTQARDSSLPCSIKKSLKLRMDASKMFVLIVGAHTDSVTKGSCQWCDSYKSYNQYCTRDYSVDKRSFIKYECDEAVKAGIKIVVLYKSARVERSKCPVAVRNIGTHIPMLCIKGDKYSWNYEAIKEALKA